MELFMIFRTSRVAQIFGIDREISSARTRAPHSTVDLRSILPRAGQIVLVAGASGSGKSSLLRAMRKKVVNHDDRPRCIDLHALAPPPDARVVDCLKKMRLE